LVFLSLQNALDELRPLNACLGTDESTSHIEPKQTVHLAHVEKQLVLSELLTAHSVPPTADTRVQPIPLCKSNDLCDLFRVFWRVQPNERVIERRVHVIHERGLMRGY
jgi:hypothetical protein